MLTAIKSSFFWQMAGGFVLGAIGMVALQPAEMGQALSRHLPGHEQRR